MRIELIKDEYLMIERLLEDAALNAVDYTWQGKIRDLKEFFHTTIAEYEKNEIMRINEVKKRIRNN